MQTLCKFMWGTCAHFDFSLWGRAQNQSSLKGQVCTGTRQCYHYQKTLHRKTFLKDWLHFVSLKASMCKSHLKFWRPWKPLGSTEGWATFFLNFKNKHQLNQHSTFLILIQRTTVQAAAYTSHTECRFELWFLGVWTNFMIPCLGRQLRSLSSMWETQVKPGSSLSLA